MHLLLPPSEAKTTGGRGRPLNGRAPHPVLGAARSQVLAALAQALRDPDDAAQRLVLPPAVRAEALAANAVVTTAPTTPALQRYSGVVYEALAAANLSPAERRIAARTIFIFSGLFGVVRGDEAIPLYRVPAKASLPGIGGCASFWRPVLERALPPLVARGCIVDLRSSDYAAMWRPDPPTAQRVVTVRVLSPTPSGRWAVVSFASKWAKGRLAAALIRRVAGGGAVTSAADVAACWAELGERAVVTGSNVELYTAP